MLNKLFGNFTEKNIIQAYSLQLENNIEDNEIIPILDILVRGNNKFLTVKLENMVGIYITLFTWF